MECRNCASERIISVTGKCSDCCSVEYNGQESDGYVPNGLGIGGDDYIEFDLCMECGTIQHDFPITDEDIGL